MDKEKKVINEDEIDALVETVDGEVTDKQAYEILEDLLRQGWVVRP